MTWACSNCTLENEDDDEKCAACETPRENDEEEYEGSDDEEGGEDESDNDSDIDLRASKGFDAVVGGALAKEAKQKAAELANAARAKLGKDAIAFLDSEEDNCVIRAALKVNFLDPTVAKIWGINYSKPIILELRFRLEHYSEPPHFVLYQSGDDDLSRYKLKDISSFGLEWQLRARTEEWLNGDKREGKDSKPNWPTKDGDFIPRILEHIVYRIQNCTKTCIICDGPLPFQMIKPSVCAKSLCVHSHEQYGLGADVASEIRDRGDVVDLLITLCMASSRGDHRRFNPFPVGVEVKKFDSNLREQSLHFMQDDMKTKNLPAVTRVIEVFPPVAELAKYPDTKSIKAYLDNLDPLAFPLLRWIITSNRAHLAKLDESERIKEMKTEYQYMFLSSPPEKESVFQELRKKHGSFWAFHGSNLGNWHSILRIGLKNYSKDVCEVVELTLLLGNTELMSTGAAYGAGIYLSPHSSTSAGYAHTTSGWDKSAFFDKSSSGYNNIQCLALCEVINAGYKANPHYVVPNEDHVLTRYFFIYTNKYTCPSVDANSLKGLKSSPLGEKK